MVGFPAIGDRIGPYRVDAEIGRGGMGIVYRATQLALNRPVALKILDPRFAADATFAARFSREANILASLDSPHVIQIFDHGVSDDRLYLAMQYVAGG
ncbi:MAG: protein kinase, partial [Propionibacteriaceae bacterium]|nr:protein kinase [Propionibacteriaceae bacterium]